MISNTCEPKREAPSADAREEVVLGVIPEIDRLDVTDVPRVDVAGGDEIFGLQIVQPCRAEGVVLVVVGAGHFVTRKINGDEPSGAFAGHSPMISKSGS